MAEIRIEKKKPVWPWILLGLIILGIILYFVFAGNDNETQTQEENNTEQMQDTNALNLKAGNTLKSTYELAENFTTDETMADYLAFVDNQKF